MQMHDGRPITSLDHVDGSALRHPDEAAPGAG
jgi:hypothetical protein